jgi:alpha-ketoglutarate-dependent taurine dioxygenase
VGADAGDALDSLSAVDDCAANRTRVNHRNREKRALQRVLPTARRAEFSHALQCNAKSQRPAAQLDKMPATPRLVEFAAQDDLF